MNESRRDFLKTGGCALGMVALATQMQHLGTMSVMAQKAIKRAAEANAVNAPSDYRALVCLYFAGGNDGNNMVIPNHNLSGSSTYLDYSNIRAASGLAVAQASLLPITVPRLGGLTFGLHPNLGPQTQNGTTIVNNGIHDLWAAGDLAVVTNLGNLVRPLTKAQYLNPAYKKPYQLFSHSDQIAQSQTSFAGTQSITGWGGRISDKMTADNNPSGIIPMITSISGAQLFTAGQSTLPMAIADSNTTLANVLNPAGFGTPPTGSNLARLNAFNTLRTQDLSSDFVKAASHVTDLAMQANAALKDTQEVTTVFPNTSIGRQLKQVARLIKERTDLSINRQIFFVQLGGFDTHTNQVGDQANLFTQMSQAMRAFYDEMTAQTLQNSVTTFTLSDFGRTLGPAGSAASTVGSDHAWGNHALVMGGAVNGGDFYGSLRPDGTGTYFPTFVMGFSGQDDADGTASSPSGRGRWIPTTSVDQYAVQFARWFGLAPADEAAVFPNLANFSGTSSNPQLNFLP